METLDNSISDNNKIPGSGCDTFTRPEEIQALSKYLGNIKKILNDNTKLDNSLLDVPGKTTGKLPEVSELSKTIEELDLSKEDRLKKLSEKLILLDDSRINSELSNKSVLLNNIKKNIDLVNNKDVLTVNTVDLFNKVEEKFFTESKELIENKKDISGLVSELDKLNKKDEEVKLSEFTEKLDISSPEKTKDYSLLGSNKLSYNLPKEKEEIPQLNKKDEEVKLSKNSIHLDINNSSKIKLDQVSLELPNDIATNDISELSNIISEDLKIDKKPNIRKLDTELNQKIPEVINDSENYDYFNPYNTESSLYDAVLKLPDDDSGEILSLDTFIDKLKVSSNLEEETLETKKAETIYFIDKNIELSENIENIPLSDKNKLEHSSNNSEYYNPSTPNEFINLDSNNEASKASIGRYNVEETKSSEARKDFRYKFFENNSIKNLNEEELYNRILNFGTIPDSIKDNINYSMEDESESSELSWYLKIKSLVSTYLNSNKGESIPEHKIKQFEERLYGALQIFQSSLELSGINIKLPEYKLGQLNTKTPSSYVRWLAEETIGHTVLTGKAREVLLKETLGLLIWSRDELEKLNKTTKHRLPGDSYFINNIDEKSLIKGAGEAISSAISKENINPTNRPVEKKNTNSWFNANRRTSISKEVADKVEENNKKEGGILGILKDTGNFFIKKTGENNYNFWSNYLQGQGIATTLTDLAGTSVDKLKNGTVEELFKILRTSPYITTADKVVTTMSWGENYNAQTLDSNTHWEIVFEPYAGNLNGFYTFLPLISEINLRNLAVHGVTTKYNKWIPFSSFDLQKEKLISKTVGLYDGEISYPTGIEFTNELRLTIVDDQFKSWKTYFETCMYASIYSSSPNIKTGNNIYDIDGYNKKRKEILENNSKEFENLKELEIEKKLKETYKLSITDFTDFVMNINDPDFGNKKDMISIDKNYQLVAPYKNLAFSCKIYVMTPQLSTITKFDLLLVLKDFVSEYSGEIDSSGTDLTLSFSIVGENPDTQFDYSVEPEVLFSNQKKEIDARNDYKPEKSNVWSNLADHAANTSIKLL